MVRNQGDFPLSTKRGESAKRFHEEALIASRYAAACAGEPEELQEMVAFKALQTGHLVRPARRESLDVSVLLRSGARQ